MAGRCPIRTFAIPVLVACWGVTASARAQEPRRHPLEPAIRIAKASVAELDDVKDYTAIFSKQEVVGGRLQPRQTMYLKFRKEPFSVYLRFIRPNEGREVLYVEGWNDDEILVHDSGIKSLVGSISVPVNSPHVRAESRYPITMTGMEKMVESLIAQWEEETKYGETEVKYYGKAKLGETPVKVIESSHPRPRKQFKFHVTRLYIEKETNLPVRVEQFGFPRRPGEKPPLLEQYTYQNVKTNAGLKDIDFSPQNPNYQF